MSQEMRGDADFAVAAISASTLFSALTYLLWLMVAVRYLYGGQPVFLRRPT